MVGGDELSEDGKRLSEWLSATVAIWMGRERFGEGSGGEEEQDVMQDPHSRNQE